MKLDDNDPLWEQHSGGSGHRGLERGHGDGARAAALYGALAKNAKLIFDLLIDRPGERGLGLDRGAD